MILDLELQNNTDSSTTSFSRFPFVNIYLTYYRMIVKTKTLTLVQSY